VRCCQLNEVSQKKRVVAHTLFAPPSWDTIDKRFCLLTGFVCVSLLNLPQSSCHPEGEEDGDTGQKEAEMKFTLTNSNSVKLLSWPEINSLAYTVPQKVKAKSRCRNAAKNTWL